MNFFTSGLVCAFILLFGTCTCTSDNKITVGKDKPATLKVKDFEFENKETVPSMGIEQLTLEDAKRPMQEVKVKEVDHGPVILKPADYYKNKPVELITSIPMGRSALHEVDHEHETTCQKCGSTSCGNRCPNCGCIKQQIDSQLVYMQQGFTPLHESELKRLRKTSFRTSKYLRSTMPQDHEVNRPRWSVWDWFQGNKPETLQEDTKAEVPLKDAVTTSKAPEKAESRWFFNFWSNPSDGSSSYSNFNSGVDLSLIDPRTGTTRTTANSNTHKHFKCPYAK